MYQWHFCLISLLSNAMTDVVKFCTSGTLVKKVSDDFDLFSYMLKSIVSRLKWCQVLWASGPNFQDKCQKLAIYNFLQSNQHIDAVMLHIRRLCAVSAFFFFFLRSRLRLVENAARYNESASRCVRTEYYIVCSARRWFSKLKTDTP